MTALEEGHNFSRETQRLLGEIDLHLNEITLRQNELKLKIVHANDTITRCAEESREQDRRLGERIDALVSAIGHFLAKKD